MISFDTIIKSLGLFYHGQSILWVEKYSRIWRYRFGNGAVFRLIALIFHSEFFFFFFRQYLIYVRISLTYKKGSYWYWQCWFRKVRAGGTPFASRKLQHLWFNPNRYIERTTRECWTNFFFSPSLLLLLQWWSSIMWNSCTLFCSFTHLMGWNNWVINLGRTTRTWLVSHLSQLTMRPQRSLLLPGPPTQAYLL